MVKAVVRSLDNQDLFPSTYTDIIYDDNGGFIVIDANNSKGFYFMDKNMVAPKYADVKLASRNGKLHLG